MVHNSLSHGRGRRRAGRLAAGLALALVAAGPAAAQDEVGVATVVNPSTLSTPPGADTRTVASGDRVIFQEEIETDATGQTQVLFLDQSSLTVGPDSYVVIDEFVFDPALAEGSLTMTLERGLVRYVGGAISKEGGVVIDTEVATVSIRGGMAIAQRLNATQSRAINLFGRVTVTPDDASSVVLADPGDFAVVERSGVVDMGQISAGELAGLYKAFEGGEEPADLKASVEQGVAASPGAEPSAEGPVIGGSPATTPPSPEAILAETENSVRSNVALGRQQEQISDTPPEVPVPSPNFTNLSGSYNATADAYETPSGIVFDEPLQQNAKGGPNSDFNRRYQDGRVVENSILRIDSDGDGVVDLVLPIAEGSFEVALSDSSSPLGPLTGSGQLEILEGDTPFFVYDLETADGSRQVQVVGGLPSDPAVFSRGGLQVFAYDLPPDEFLLQDLPFTPTGLAQAFPNIQASQLLVATPPGGGVDPLGGPYRSSVLWMAFSIEGEGPSQKSIVQASPGRLLDLGNGKPVLTQTVRGSILQSGSQPGDVTLTEAGQATLVDAEGNAFYGENAERVALSNNGPFPLDDPDRAQQAQNINQVFYQPYDDLGGTAVGYTAVAPQSAAPDGAGGDRPTRVLRGYASGVGVTRLPGGDFSEVYVLQTGIDEAGPAALLAFDGSDSSATGVFQMTAASVISQGDAPERARWVFGGAGAVNSAYLDADRYAAGESLADRGQGFDGEVNRNDTGADGVERYGFRSYLVGHEPIPPDQAFPNVTFCACDYLEWGYWGGEYNWDPTGSEAGRRERVHIGTYVAGERPSVADINGLSGSATHAGHVLGTVVLGDGSQYLAAGNYSQTFDFGRDTGTFNIGGFDGRDFDGGTLGLTDSGHPADFASTNAAVSADGLNANVRASFFKGGGDAARQVGGTFTVTDGGRGNYSAAGTVAADRK